MTTPDINLWEYFDTEAIVVARDALEETRAGGKIVLQCVAWLHNTFYTGLMKKACSPENFVEALARQSGPNEGGAEVLKNQLAECRIIADVLQTHCRTAQQKSPLPGDYVSKNVSKLLDWCIVDANIKLTYTVLEFLNDAVFAIYGAPKDTLQAIHEDKSLDAATHDSLIGAVAIMTDIENTYDRELFG